MWCNGSTSSCGLLSDSSNLSSSDQCLYNKFAYIELDIVQWRQLTMFELRKCENCNKKHNGEYASGRFCSKWCSHSFVTKIKRKEINIKVSKTMRSKLHHPKNGFANPGYARDKAIQNSLKTRIRKQNEKINNLPTEQLPKHLRKKKLLIEENYKCHICRQDEMWQGKKLSLQMDHIDGNSNNNTRENLRIVCPNCHSQTETWGTKRGKNKKRMPS